MKQRISGFTIVELLIVIVVIAILAAISIVAYNGFQTRAHSSTVQSDLSAAMKKLELYRVDSSTSSFPNSHAQLSDANISVSRGSYDTVGNNLYYCLNRATGQSALGARTVNNAAGFVVVSGGSIRSSPGIGAAVTCQSVGLTDHTDTNASIGLGYNTSSGWQAWVK